MKNFSFRFSFCLVYLALLPPTYGQNCEGAQNQLTFSANQMEGILQASGSLYGDGSQSGYTVQTELEERVATIFAHGLWIGGKDPGGALKVAASTDGLVEGITDYFPGPLYNGDPNFPDGGIYADPFRGTTNELTCEDWDKVWIVSKTEIEDFRQDFSDNGVLDEAHPTVLAWPGIGSPTFSDFHDFALPAYVPEGLAPFFDVDEDGIYNPLNGDYPHVSQSAILPDLITWSVYNDAGGDHLESLSPNKLQFEIQQTTWAYACPETEWLNQSVFTSFKLINNAIERLDSAILGLWTDFDLGCPIDDYMGSVPALSTFYAYNADNVDGLMPGGCPGGGAYFMGTAPVQAVTFLNHPISSFMYYEGASANPLPALQAPQTPQEHYNFMSGRFRDGNYMVAEGNGYDPDSNLPNTSFAFSGQPGEAGEWSLLQNPTFVDLYGIGSVALGDILPEHIVTIDVAYSLHQSPDNDHLQNVNLMSATIPELQAIYNSGFTSLCGITGVKEVDDSVKLDLFPNPTSSQLTILLPDSEVANVIIYSATGQEVMRSNEWQNGRAELDVSRLTAGIYFVHALQGDKIAVGKFVKQ